jgi:predicted phage gp36 major capsid-like protein
MPRWSMNTFESHRNHARLVAAVAGAASAVTLAYLGVVSSPPESPVVVTGAGPGAMSTGATTSSTAVPTTMAVPMATPTVKATPFWGQPTEP